MMELIRQSKKHPVPVDLTARNDCGGGWKRG
jgi:hypothetical protein